MHHLLFYDLCRVQIAIECNLAKCTSIPCLDTSSKRYKQNVCRIIFDYRQTLCLYSELRITVELLKCCGESLIQAVFTRM